jgi:hypothetical protein
MLTQTKSQGVLFSEPNYSETGVWVELSEGIDPAEWAYLCRYLGRLDHKEFKKISRKVYGNPDGLIERFKEIFKFEQSDFSIVPLVKWGK